MPHREPEYRRRQREEAAENQRYAEREWDEATQKRNHEETVAAIKGIGKELDRAVDEEAPKNKGDRRRHRAEIFGLWAAAAVGVGAILMGNHDASQQFSEMQRADRAWVSIEPAIGDVTWSADGLTIGLKYTLKNTGNSPAMHVSTQDAIVPWITPPDEGAFAILKKMTSGQRRLDKGPLGVPLFPHETLEVYSVVKYSRAAMERSFRYLRTFKHNPTDPDIPTDEVNKDIALMLVYFVDYLFDTGNAHHQHSCMARIDRVDPRKSVDLGVALPLGENLSPPNVRLTAVSFGCEAD